MLALPAAGAEPPLPTLRIEPITGGTVLFLKNVSPQPLTAYVIELVDYPGSFFSLWKDEITSGAIAPNQEKRIQVENMTIGAAPDYVKVTGAVYADGSSAGAREKVDQMVACRRFSVDAVRGIIRRLETAKQQKVSKEDASANLKSAVEFMLVPKGTDRNSQLWINQAEGRQLYARTIEYLDKHTLDEALAKLHEWEKALIGSKPDLGVV